MLNHENVRLIILYTVSAMNAIFRVKLCPDRRICPTCAMAYVAAKKDPLSHRRRCEMNSGMASGTSVSPTAPFTYLRILYSSQQGREICWKWGGIYQLELAFAISSKHRIRWVKASQTLKIHRVKKGIRTSSAKSEMMQFNASDSSKSNRTSKKHTHVGRKYVRIASMKDFTLEV